MNVFFLNLRIFIFSKFLNFQNLSFQYLTDFRYFFNKFFNSQALSRSGTPKSEPPSSTTAFIAKNTFLNFYDFLKKLSSYTTQTTKQNERSKKRKKIINSYWSWAIFQSRNCVWITELQRDKQKWYWMSTWLYESWKYVVLHVVKISREIREISRVLSHLDCGCSLWDVGLELVGFYGVCEDF